MRLNTMRAVLRMEEALFSDYLMIELDFEQMLVELCNQDYNEDE